MHTDELTWSAFFDSWEIYQAPVLCAAVAGLVLGFLSAYIVLRRMVFVSAAVTQSAGLGVALSFYAGIHWGLELEPAFGAIALSVVASLLLVFDPARFHITREALLGIVFAFSGGAAVLIGSRISQEAHDIQSILFGIGVLIEPDDLRRVVVAAVLVMTIHLWWFRGLVFSTFDPLLARVHRLPTKILDSVLLVSIGVMVGVSAKALGSLPVFALSTIPATAALMLTRGHVVMTFVLAAMFGALSGAAGYVLAFFEEFDVGAAQTVFAVGLAVVAAIAGQLIHRVLKSR